MSGARIAKKPIAARLAPGLFALTLAASAAADEATIGVLAPEGAEVAVRDWAPLQAHLERSLPDTRFRIAYHDLPGMRAAIAAGQLDFFVANSGLYVEMEAAHGASRIATLDSPGAPSPAQALASAILVRSDRNELSQLSDLAGRRVMAVSDGAFGGWQLAWRELLRAGVDPERDLAGLAFAGFPMQRIVAGVQRGEADAGVVRACLLESMIMQGAVRPDELRVLNAAPPGPFPCLRSTPLYPNWPFAVLRDASPELAKRVATALLTMPRTAEGYGWAVPADYQPVRELFRELRIGPYAYLREQSFESFLRRHWGWFLAAALALAAGVVHILRVEVLVMRRTRELSQALEARDRAEAQARTQREKLDHLGRLSILGEMSSMLAHEMNQPLAAIGNFAQGIARRVQAGRLQPQPLLEASAEIAGQAERAAGIMQRIRAFAKKRTAQPVPVDLCRAADAALRLLADAGSAMAPVQRRFPRHAWVRADALQVEQVLLNLLKNAQDALQPLPPPERRIVLAIERNDGGWRTSVRDNGPGLMAAQRERLFEPFFTTKPDGLGLGLAICQSAIEAHGGRLWARPNDPEAGLTVGFDPGIDHGDDD